MVIEVVVVVKTAVMSVKVEATVDKERVPAQIEYLVKSV
jgi:hypothetical protein